MLIDEVDLTISAGKGGDGIVHFYSDKWRPKGGPDGGNGGHGGDVYFEGINDINKLSQFRYKKEFEAQAGEPGGRNQRSGKNGEDLVLQIPVGTVVSIENGKTFEIEKPGERFLIAKGGRGGFGNFHFRSSVNQTPQEHQIGFPGENKKISLRLKLIAQIGLIGLPNAGKTSLLNELTSANAKVANYAFTTLEPNLGVMKSGHIMADIPGLIEGASEGKGLGFRFLKHVERTQLLVHCISCESENPKKDYEIVRNELNNFASELISKPEIIVLTKTDLVSSDKLESIEKLLKPKLSVSIIDTDSLKKLNDLIAKSLG